MVTSKLVRIANQATAEDIAAAAEISATQTFREKTLGIRVAAGPNLSEDEQGDVWSLWETNTRALVEPSSLGYHPKEKRKELFHRFARFILVFDHDVQENREEAALVAFSKFRFERDQGEDLLYCYELQVSETYRNAGLGRFFVEKLTAIGKHWHMSKIMLTVLKSNVAARQFYSKTGFIVDPISPDYESTSEDDTPEDDEPEHEAADYEILSKALD
ncbi:acyl-CoA N-acyltransferase [Trametes gibbosa]|nr:acyl-CoA N-acyltransferase [Trametes gibbosa]